MALVLESTTEYLNRTASLPAKSPITFCCWLKMTAKPSANTPFILLDPSNRYTQLRISYSSPNASVSTFAYTDGPDAYANGTVLLSTDTWYFLAGSVLLASGYLRAYSGAAVDANLTAKDELSWGALTQTGTPADLRFQGYTGTISICGARLWQAELTLAELEAEFDADKGGTGYVAQKTANLWGQWKMLTVADGGDDTSGNSRNLTPQGSLSEVAGPFDPPGPGTTPGSLNPTITL